MRFAQINTNATIKIIDNQSSAILGPFEQIRKLHEKFKAKQKTKQNTKTNNKTTTTTTTTTTRNNNKLCI